jgi:predicted TIM-barrel fold metal-dependent hydrolase
MGMPTDIGIVDLGIGFPYQSVEEKKHAYDFFRANLKDAESLREMEFPAEYMFKNAPDVVDPSIDPIEWTVEKMQAFNIVHGKIGLSERGIEAKRRYPELFSLSMSVNPHEGVDALRKMDRAKAEHDIKSVSIFPSGLVPQAAVNDKKLYPVYAKCVELDIPMCINGGIVGPRMPSWPQHVEHFDEVLYDFPELTMVMMHGGEPWTALAAKLMLKWPGLHYMTSAFAPKYYPQDIINFANSRGSDKVMYCGYFPAGLTLERQFQDMPKVPFKDEVWPKFLRENAIRVFKLDVP